MRNGGSPTMFTTVLAYLAIVAVLGALLLGLLFPSASGKRRPRNLKTLQRMADELQMISRQQRWLASKDNSRESRRAAWLMAKADYAVYRFNSRKKGEKHPALADRFLVEDTLEMLILACHQNQAGCAELTEEQGSRLRAYRSSIDDSYQTYSVSVPKVYDPTVRWPLIVSMHGHGWFAPFQGHPAPVYAGAFCVAPRGRGATDYKELGELDVLAVIEEVKRDFNIDPDRVYLTGSSMGGTGAFSIGCHYADQFAAINPIVGNADNQAWTERWGWNRRFPGRYDALRKWLQDGHTARAFAENLLTMPTFVVAGSADTVVPPAHSRAMVELLRKYHGNVQYWEFPGCGHGGFPAQSLQEALAWTCSWQRNPAPASIFWKADLLRHGKAWWTRMEQFERPLTTGYLTAAVTNGQLSIRTSNLLALSFQRPATLLPSTATMSLQIDGKTVALENLPTTPDAWIALRKSPIHGWLDARSLPAPGVIKKRGLEGPISEVFMSPFLLVVGTSAESPEMRNAWLQEALAFQREWRRRNGASCPLVLDSQCTAEQMESHNLILFGGIGDNDISNAIHRNIPLSDVMANLPIRNEDPQNGNRLNAPDLGSFILYPNTEYAPDRLVVMLSANSPEAVWQMWGRFGNWFNWGVYDSSKYFDYAVFDSASSSPETMLIIGWFGTDWKVESGKYFLGREELRAQNAPQCYPPFEAVPETINNLLLAELKPVRIDQMRGAVGFGRGFFGEKFTEAGAIGLRAPATLDYQLDGQFAFFTSDITLVNPPEAELCRIREKGEAITFTVKGDGKPLQQHTITWAKPTAHFQVPISGVTTLTLDARPTGGPSWLHLGCAWLTPTVWRGTPAEQHSKSAENQPAAP